MNESSPLSVVPQRNGCFSVPLTGDGGMVVLFNDQHSPVLGAGFRAPIGLGPVRRRTRGGGQSGGGTFWGYTNSGND